MSSLVNQLEALFWYLSHVFRVKESNNDEIKDACMTRLKMAAIKIREVAFCSHFTYNSDRSMITIYTMFSGSRKEYNINAHMETVEDVIHNRV